MSGHESYPPPGGHPPPPGQPAYGQPEYGQPAYGQPEYGQPVGYAALGPYPAPGWSPPPGMLGAAHKPGAIPLRPLGLGDLYDGAFRIIRYNPKVTVGAPVLVSAAALLLPALVTALLTWAVGVSLDPDTSARSTGELLAIIAIVGSLVVGLAAQSVGSLLVTGMIAHVVQAAAIGRRLGLGEAWRATRGKRWRLLGLAALLLVGWLLVAALYTGLWVVVLLVSDGATVPVVVGLVSGPIVLVLSVWAYVRVTYLAVPALMLDDVGVLGALRRAFTLTRGAFWRTFGIALLTFVVAQVAATVLTCPLALLTGVASVAIPEHELLINVVLQALTTVLSAALVTPFMTTVSTLQYVDLRMRKEAFDVELMTRAGITAS